MSTLFKGLEVLSSASYKAKLFSENCNLDDSVSLAAFPYRTNLKMDNTPVTPKLIKKVNQL